MFEYLARYSIFSGGRRTINLYEFRGRDDDSAFNKAKIQATKIQQAFGAGVRVKIDAVVNRGSGRLVFCDFERGSLEGVVA
ncbi:MAG: hypothetical protein KKD18_00200 [Nanoarchaeota archaeon]|nr:hypothetical protein [Nanoarchaeota archaeon]MBU0976819.1 hypothetical protein [Nanoarchaeota archaeon]